MELATKSDRIGKRRTPRALRGALLSLVLCIVLVGFASSASAADLSRGAMNAADKYADGLTADSPSIYGVRHAPIEAFLRKSVKSAVSVVFLPPASYDLRTLGRLTSVKDQGNYGTCWTFATYGSMESCLLPGESRDFSENNLAWNAGYDWGFADGGNYTMSTAYLSRWDGPINEADDTYGSGAHDPSALTKQKHVQDVLILAPKNGASCDDIKNALMTHGAVATYMYADFGYSYYDSSTNAFYYPGSADSDHAVTIVGWDDNYPASNFATTPPGNGAFIVRNSWGTGWGEAGYFYASYYDTWVGVDAWCFSGNEATNNYTGNYGHDPLGCTTFVGWTGENSLWLTNVFTATSSQSITAASVHTAYSGIAYEVWAGATKSSMTQRGSGVFTDAGYHTVDLSTPLAVTNGQSFAVGFKVTGSTGEDYLACCEYPFEGWSSGATAAAGQSFFSFEGSTWYDFTVDGYANTNLCIKAFAGSSTPQPDPVLTSVSPNHGTVGSTVVLTGTNLGTSGTVYFGSTPATTSSWNATTVVATVPAGSGTVNVTVSTGGKTSNAVSFTYDTVTLNPVLTAVSPNHGSVGSTVVLMGTDLGTSGTVYFGSTPATTSSWAATAIVATVPAGSGTVNVTVSTGGKTSNAVSFTYDIVVSDPVLSSVNPSHGTAASTVVLMGTDLGTSGTVFFGATSATTSSWSSTAIVATVPAGSGTVNVTVSTGGKTSNAVSFTYDTVTPTPVLTALIPNTGAPGSGVVITGSDLGASGTVSFGATSAATSSWGATAIVATVPASLPAGPVNVTVSTGGKTSNALTFTVTTNGGSAPTMSFSCPDDLTKWHNHDLLVTFTVSDPDGDADKLLYSYDQSTWYEVVMGGLASKTLRVPAEADHSWDGATLIYCKARDLALHESAAQQFTVRIDTRKPVGKALYAVTVRQGRTATLRYKIIDTAPNGGTATGVTIKIKNRNGRTVKTFRLGTKKVNTAYSVRFTCKLAKGTYRFYVSGKDVAGNTAKVGSNRLTVR